LIVCESDFSKMNLLYQEKIKILDHLNLLMKLGGTN
jgi:hypothetical protein